MTIPPDTRAPGQAGHVGDHNAISDALSAMASQISAILTSGLTTTGSIDISQPGQGLEVAEGTNGRQGSAVLIGGTVTVANTTVTASTRIQLTSQADGGTPGFLRISARVPGTSFTIKSSSVTDTSTVAYFMTEPG